MSRVQKIGLEVELAMFQQQTPVVCDFFPYTKEQPLERQGSLYHKDASMFELAMAPCRTGKELDSVYQQALRYAASFLPSGTVFKCLPAAEYTEEELAKDPYASVLGCGASANIYGDSGVMPDAYENNVRYAGLHINVELNGDSPNDISVLGMDATAGLKSVRDWEQPFRKDIIQRRTVYGKAGEHRMKPFGMEYRTLPASSWEETTGSELFALTERAVKLGAQELLPHAACIQHAINTCNAREADRLIKIIHGNSGAI